jgi:hypothetical protein
MLQRASASAFEGEQILLSYMLIWRAARVVGQAFSLRGAFSPAPEGTG